MKVGGTLDRNPFQKKNHGVQGFRRSLLSSSQKNSRTTTTEALQEENVSTTRENLPPTTPFGKTGGSLLKKKSLTKTRKKVTFGGMSDQEDGRSLVEEAASTGATLAVTDTPRRPSSGLAVLRHNLRTTVSPHAQTMSPATPAAAKAIPGTTATPKMSLMTPNSLLKTEMNHTSIGSAVADESLLLSPMIVNDKNVKDRNLGKRQGIQSTAAVFSKIQQSHQEINGNRRQIKEEYSAKAPSTRTALARRSPQSPSLTFASRLRNRRVQVPSIRSLEPTNSKPKINEPASGSVQLARTNNVPKPNDQASAYQNEALKAKKQSIPSNPNSTTCATQTTINKPEDRETRDARVALSTIKDPSKSVLSRPPLPTHTIHSKFDAELLSQSLPITSMVSTKPSPFTPRGTRGVCLDLSGMFSAAKATNGTVQRPNLLSRCPTTQKRDREVKTGMTVHHEESEGDWAEKQCDTFTSWLNYTLQPVDESEHHENTDREDGSETEDNIAHRTLLLHQRMATARRRALEVYQEKTMQKFCKGVESEIERGRLALRKDRNMCVDLTVRGKVLELLLSYSTPWLRLGLETLYGEPILPESPHAFSPGKPQQHRSSVKQSKRKVGNLKASPLIQDSSFMSKRALDLQVPLSRMKQKLKNFIIQRVLSDEATLAKYTKGKCNVPSGKFEIMYHDELRKIVIYRLLVLFVFLDKAKRQNILEKSSRLFMNDSKVKSSQDVLLTFCREFMAAEGNLVKHLARVGMKVTYVQKTVDEIDFSIINLAVDLRDGVRLARMTEILTGLPRNSLLSTLRLPAVSRLQKLHNVSTAIKALKKFGVPISDDVAAHHIVDGHREMVLKLMWFVVAHCCLNDILDVERVQLEIHRLEQSQGVAPGSQSTTLDDDESTVNNDYRDVLLRWANAVCYSFGFRASNLTDDFADGKAFCLLIHYYHPDLIRLDEIRPTLRELSTRLAHEKLESTRANERFNTLLARSRMSSLGGIPKMVPICDSSQPPDERSMLLCLSSMCSRLIESRGEIRASILIQRVYRKYRGQVDEKKKMAAAKIILQVWRVRKTQYYEVQCRRYGPSVTIIEKFVLRHQANLHLIRKKRLMRESANRAATRIQVRIIWARKLLMFG